jgi:exosortase/archaeosortase family protein
MALSDAGGRGMIQSSLALPVLLIVFWSAWSSLAARLDNAETIAPVALVGAVAAAPMVLRLARRQGLLAAPLLPLLALLAAYGAACLWVPTLMRIALAAMTILYALHAAGRGGAPSAPLFGLLVLALPVLPTFEFYFAYPMRVASAAITVQLLGLQGLSVVQEGVALRAGERLFEFDAPCAGVHMFWAALFLVSGVSLLRSFGLARYLAALTCAGVLAVLANAVRAASLVYVEGGVFPIAMPTWVHSAVGVAAFALCAGTLLMLTQKLARRAS